MTRIEKINKFFMNPLFWIILSAILLLVMSMLGVPMTNDEGVWAYIGRIWADHGLLPYTGAIENKATGIYMLYGLSHKLFGLNIWFPRLVALLSILLTGEFIRRITKKLCNSDRAAIIAMVVFLLTMSLQIVDGAFAETETFMNLFRALTFLLVLVTFEKSKEKQDIWILSAGFAFAWAISFKQLAVTDGLPLLFFFYFLNHKNTKQTIKYLIQFSFGTIIGLAVSLVPFLLSGGTISQYIDGAWIILTQSGSSPHSLVSRVSGFFRHFFQQHLSIFTMGLLGYLVLWKKMKQLVPLALPLLVWALADFAAYNADGWYLNHHFKVFLISWSIIFGIVVNYVIGKLRTHREGSTHEQDQKLFFVVLIGILLVFLVLFEREYYQNVRKFIKGDVHDHKLRDLGYFARDLTEPGDYIYFWGFHIGPTYYYSERLSPSRYFSEPFLGRPGALEEVQADLLKNTPMLIFIPEEKFPIPAWLREFIDVRYKLLEERSGHTIFIKL
jgi:hypothetical protein